MAQHNETGKWGEQIAVDLMTERGYAIRERNWRCGHDEIDIIAVHDDVLIFGEVKTRSDKDVDPFEAIGKKKIAALIKAAKAYLEKSGLPHSAQFDLIGISGTPDDYTVEYLEDAIDPPALFYK